MSKISDFFARAVKAQISVAGETLAISRPKTGESWEATGILTSRDGSMTAESGGIVYTITGHALIPRGQVYAPIVGDRIAAGG